MRSGVVIGKFYPPHRGHKHLIDTALKQVDRLFILVCDHPVQTIPASLRAEWLKEIHPQAEVIVTPDDLPDEPEPWAKRTVELLGCAPDLVFTSEDYGEGYGKALGSQHVLVDRERTMVPCSGTAIREDPLKCLEFLEPRVKAYFLPRVVLIGAESTGKTTMAQAMAERLGVEWVPEFGREYCEQKFAKDPGAGWETKEFVFIAKEQGVREELAARRASHLVVCDTDAFATATWHERYLGTRAPEVEAAEGVRKNRLYLVSPPDVPFVQDGTRDGEQVRDWMHKRFIEELEAQARPYKLLSGDYEARLGQGLEAAREFARVGI